MRALCCSWNTWTYSTQQDPISPFIVLQSQDCQMSPGRRLCRWWGARAQESMLSITSSLQPQLLSLPARQHAKILLLPQTQLVGLWYAVKFLMWAFWSTVLNIFALSCRFGPCRFIQHIHPYREMQQKLLASAAFWALHTHTGAIFSLVFNLWVWDVLAKSSWCLGDVHWRKSKYNCPVPRSWTEPYSHVPGACAGLCQGCVPFST